MRNEKFGKENGNFEFDAAMDILGVWMQKIVDAIREGFSYDSVDTLYGNMGEAQIVANIDILITICERYETYPDLTVAEVTKWKQEFLAAYDRITRTYSRAEDIADSKKRRIVIEATFDKLQHLVNELWDDL